MTVVFDIGMYDGADTAYYLESGFRVIAVEANPELHLSTSRRFEAEIQAGKLVCLNAAVTSDGSPVRLTLCGADLGSSTIYSERIEHMRPAGSIEVPGIRFMDLVAAHGVPDYLKVDIEGADRLCVLGVKDAILPRYVSFELGADAGELVAHLAAQGYEGFKIVNQNLFLELENQYGRREHFKMSIMRRLGYGEPRLIRRAGRFFVSGHSSGPVPWHGDGRWRSADETMDRLRSAASAGMLSGWYDIHAAFRVGQ